MEGALSPETREYPIMGELSGHQQEPCLAFGAKGGFMVWHHDSGRAGDPGRLVVQSLNRGMVGMGLPVPLSQASEETREARPSIALLMGGGAVIAWEAGPRDSRDVQVRFMSSSGLFTTATITANTRVQGDQFQPTVAVLAAGGVVVAWTSTKQDSSGNGVYAQRFTATGVKIGSEFLVNGSIKWNQGEPSLAPMSDGRFAAVWVSESINGQTDHGAPNLRGNLMGRLFMANGQPVAGEYRINHFDAICSKPGAYSLGDGFVVVWEQQDEKTMLNQSDIYVRSFNKNGIPLAKETRWNALVAGKQGKPALAISKGAGLLVWECEVKATHSREVHARMLSGGAEFRVNQNVRYHQQQPVIGADGNGNFLVAWVDFMKPRNSVLTAIQYSLSDRSDVTSGGHVSYEGAGAASLVLSAKKSVPTDVVGEEIQRRYTEQQLVVEFKADEKSRQAAMVAQAAAAAKAEGLLQQLAVEAQKPAVSTVGSVVGQGNHPQIGGGMMNNQGKTGVVFSNRPVTSGAVSGAASLSSVAQLSISGNRAFVPKSSIRRRSDSVAAGLSMGGGGASPYRQVNQAMPRGMARLGSRVTQQGGRGMSFGQGGNNLRMVGRGPLLTQTQKITTARRVGSKGLATLRSQTTGSSQFEGTAATRFNGMRTQRMPSQTQAQQNRASSHVNASLVRGGAGYKLQWASRTGSRYQVQRSRDSNNWVNDGPVKRGTGQSLNASVSATGQYRYFRVIKSQ